jgi:two-component system sensor histidine kinase HydH
MAEESTHNGFWTSVSPWILVAAAALLLIIFAFMSINYLNRQKASGIRLLTEKGAALIRSFEAGTRTGMMGMPVGSFRLQRLLTETARQPDISYLMVTDADGRILAHSNASQIGSRFETDLDLEVISRTLDLKWREVTTDGNHRLFEVFRKFAPTIKSVRKHGGPMGRHHPFRLNFEHDSRDISSDLVIFVGLEMESIEAARMAETRQIVVMTVMAMLIGFAGIVLLFLAQSYRIARSSLSQARALSGTVIDHMPIGLMVIDPYDCITTLNPDAESVLQLTQKDCTGKNVGECLPLELRQQLARLKIQKKLTETELDCTLGTGRVIPVAVGGTILSDEDESFLGYVLLIKDLREIHHLRKELIRNQRLATVGQLAGGVAHEIRNPLSSIKGFATYFKERYPHVPEDQHIAGIMIQEVERLDRVVGQLMAFSRPLKLTQQDTPIRVLVDDALALASKQIIDGNISVKTRIQSGLDTARIDPDRIKQVLLNLILNAIEAMPDGGILTVDVAKNESRKELQVKIADTGAGITGENLGHIFDPYFTTRPSGTGLGLAIVHNIIDAHDGKIEVKSKVSEGTTFTIHLPG